MEHMVVSLGPNTNVLDSLVFATTFDTTNHQILKSCHTNLLAMERKAMKIKELLALMAATEIVRTSELTKAQVADMMAYIRSLGVDSKKLLTGALAARLTQVGKKDSETGSSASSAPAAKKRKLARSGD